MHFNSFFLEHLAKELHQCLQHFAINECFTQEKDELILHFTKSDSDDFYFKFCLNPTFTSLSFPGSFARTNKNSTNIFQICAGAKVKEIKAHQNERALSIVLETDYIITLKFYGNRANAILFKENKVVDLFKSKLKADYALQWHQLDRILDVTFQNFESNDGKLNKTIPTLGKEASEYLNEQFLPLFGQLRAQWQLVENLLDSFKKSEFYLKILDQKPVLSLLPSGGEIIEKYTSAIEACNGFYLFFVKFDVFDREKSQLISQIEKNIYKNKLTVEQLQKRILTFETGAQNNEIADIIMANLHLIYPKTEKITLFDFYRNQNLEVKLKPDLSAQKNAENYYRKAKNEKIEIEYLHNSIATKQAQIISELEQIEAIKPIIDLRELRKVAKFLQKNEVKVAGEDFPFKEFVFMGYQIWVGRNAQNSDLLTLKYAKKDDMWFHAKDVVGSHVVLKHKSGQNFPKLVLERAASLAAYNSKRKNDGLCPVIMTPKKYVRKPKNIAAGKVVIDKEEIIMVVPQP